MNSIRKAVVAGSFYDNNVFILKRQMNKFFEKAIIKKKYSDIMGIISPHAGYIYSGQCAAYSYKALSQREFDTAIIIAPSHRASGFKFSIGNYDYYETPFDKIPVNKKYSDLLLSFPDFHFYSDVHKYEHSLEVQLPFLQMINPKANIVPILLGDQNLENSFLLAGTIFDVFSDKMDKIIFIISSDLSHYYDVKTAFKKDKFLLELIKEQNPNILWDNYLNKKVEACGIAGILTLIRLANLLGYKDIETLKYMHSGEINNDYNQVVGYCSSVCYKEERL